MSQIKKNQATLKKKITWVTLNKCQAILAEMLMELISRTQMKKVGLKIKRPSHSALKLKRFRFFSEKCFRFFQVCFRCFSGMNPEKGRKTPETDQKKRKLFRKKAESFNFPSLNKDQVRNKKIVWPL